MATYLNSVAATAPVYQGLGKGALQVASNVITMATGDLALNAVTPAVRLPRGARVVDVVMHFTDMDTSGSPTLAFHVGDAGDNDRFISAGTATAAATLRAGNNATAAANFAAHTAYTAETVINITASTAAATAAAGTIAIAVYYVTE